MAVLDPPPPALAKKVKTEEQEIRSARRPRGHLLWVPVLLAYAGLLAFVITKHEPWFDEAQAWLIARESDLTNLFGRVRYEGQPALWHLLLMLPAKTLPFGALNWISGALGTFGAYLFLRHSPFPTAVKVLVPFSFFLFYQYGVVARNYALMPMVLFAIAMFYRRRHERPAAFGALLFLLACTSSQGFLIAAALLLILGAEVLLEAKRRSEWPPRAPALTIVSLGACLGLLGLSVLPPEDVLFQGVGLEGFDVGKIFIVAGGMMNNSMTDNLLVLSLSVAATVWFLYRKKVLHLYVVPTAFLLAFFAGVHRAPWHEGVLFLIWIFALWIGLQRNASFPPSQASDESEADDPQEQNRWDRWSRLAALTMLAVVCLYQVRWTVQTAAMDVEGPYSGSKELAQYLKAEGLSDSTIFGVHWSSFAVNAYFDRNIFSNYSSPENVSFWLWSKKIKIIEDMPAIERLGPDFVVLGIKQPGSEEAMFQALPSYRPRKVFPGAIFWKGGMLQPDLFILMERQTPPNT